MAAAWCSKADCRSYKKTDGTHFINQRVKRTNMPRDYQDSIELDSEDNFHNTYFLNFDFICEFLRIEMLENMICV